MRKKNKTDTHKKREERREKLKEIIPEVYRKKAGNISAVCQEVGISRYSYYKWLNEDEEFRKKIEEADEVLLDVVESKLYQLIMQGNITAIIFYLKNKGAKRGWNVGGKFELQHTGEIKTTPELNVIQVLNKVDKKTGRKIGEILNEAIGEVQEPSER